MFKTLKLRQNYIKGRNKVKKEGFGGIMQTLLS